jgi:hypothetical protein
MLKFKIDGEDHEFKNWKEVHDEFSTFSHGTCAHAAEAHCGGPESCNGQSCDCHMNCVKETLNVNHNWKQCE